MPKFNSISISGYHIQEAGANQAIELAFTLADGVEYVRTGIKSGMDVDTFAGRLSFFWAVGMNFYLEIAKMRAARLLWWRLMKQFKPKSQKSMMLRTHSQTSGWSLTEQDPYNNVVRTTIEAMAAVFGGTQSLHTNALDEAIALPTEFSARIARNTQIIIQEETHITNVVDPWAGSYMMEKLTQDMADKAWALIEEIEAMGGMTKAVESGWAKMKVEECAADKQARIDSGKDVIVGVNKYKLDKQDPSTSSTSTTTSCAKPRSNAWPASAPPAIRRQSMPRWLRSPPAPRAAKATCSISRSRPCACVPPWAKSPTRWKSCSAATAPTRRRLPASTELGSRRQDQDWQALKADIEAFVAEEGRRPRIMIAKLGQDGHDRGSKVVASAFADLGFDIDIGPLFQTPEEAARHAVENDVHAVGCSSLAAGHKTLVPAIIKALKDQGADDIITFVGGVIPAQDYDALYAAGAKGIFGPGTRDPDLGPRSAQTDPRRPQGVSGNRLEDRRACPGRCARHS
jgi:methylmalonyl-CoA mutase